MGLCGAGRCLAIHRDGVVGGIPVLDELRLMLEFSGRNKLTGGRRRRAQEGSYYLFGTVD